MTNRAKFIAIFATGFIVGTVFAATAVSWKWNRDFDDWSAMGLADQANVAREIYAGRSEELAARILNALRGYVVDMDRNFKLTHPATTGECLNVMPFAGTSVFAAFLASLWKDS